MMTSTISPLALPKGTRKQCELCQKPARLQCLQCRVTFYCDPDHQAADWVGIHQEVCPRLAWMRRPAPPLVLQADRDAHHAQARLRMEELLGVCREVARGKLGEGRHQEALPALQLALACGLELYGSGAIPLVPLYLMLGRAYMGLGRLGRARVYLSDAEWSMLQNPGCERVLLHQLHRTLGCLHTSTGDLESALFHLATDVYHATEEFGLDSTVPCGGYFLMAEVFRRQEKKQVARSLYSQVATTWHSHLTRLCEPYLSSGSIPIQPPFDYTQLVESDRMLRSMLALEGEKEEKEKEEKEEKEEEEKEKEKEEEKEEKEEKEEEEEKEEPTSERDNQGVLLNHSLAMLWFLAGDAQQVLELGRMALQGAQQALDHGRAGSIQSMLRLVGSQDPEPMQTQEPSGALGPPDLVP
ncbi:zinc finger MYND domain-containing protein 12 [Gadus morhua]|uniref:MYND-type domain-containing protein n=1 Tax=Gadus morhua TaxID=8049 RepID=A0A8C4ZLD1_GADMO|nr:zinc finger MYND domain-containing protein 12 [Gadus morhua]